MSVGDSDAMFPCCAVAHDPKRSAIVAAHPSCIRGVRQPTPTSGGTWNAPPVPTSTVALFVNLGPRWQLAQPTSTRSKIARPAAAAFASTHVGAGGAGMALTHAESAPVCVAVEGGSAHPHDVDVLHDRREVRLVARPVVRRRARDRPAERRGAALVAVEQPHVPVVAALGVARRARDERARVRVEDVVARVALRDRPRAGSTARRRRTGRPAPAVESGTTHSAAGSRVCTSRLPLGVERDRRRLAGGDRSLAAGAAARCRARTRKRLSTRRGAGPAAGRDRRDRSRRPARPRRRPARRR